MRKIVLCLSVAVVLLASCAYGAAPEKKVLRVGMDGSTSGFTVLNDKGARRQYHPMPVEPGGRGHRPDPNDDDRDAQVNNLIAPDPQPPPGLHYGRSRLPCGYQGSRHRWRRS